MLQGNSLRLHGLSTYCVLGIVSETVLLTKAQLVLEMKARLLLGRRCLGWLPEDGC